MKYTFTLLILLFLISCGTKKNQIEHNVETIDEAILVTVELKIVIHIPYCGGARPTDDMINRTKPVSASFMIIGDNDFVRKVKSNELGLIELNLPVGKYHLKELSKMVPFEEFFANAQQPKDSNIKVGSRECYQRFWDKNVIDFEIPTTTTTVIKANGRLFSDCYTSNPCDTYTGPIRP